MPKSTAALCTRLTMLVPAAAAFNNTQQQQDGTEWIITLIEAIGNELEGHLKAEWEDLFKVEVIEHYECTNNSHKENKQVPAATSLQLPIVHVETGEPLTSLKEILLSYFGQEQLDKRCFCGATTCWKHLRLARHPTLLLLQYKRFVHADG